MSPTNRRRGTSSSSMLPLVAAVCALIIAREALQYFFPGLSYWVVFVVALVVGWFSYSVVERLLARRRTDREGQ